MDQSAAPADSAAVAQFCAAQNQYPIRNPRTLAQKSAHCAHMLISKSRGPAPSCGEIRQFACATSNCRQFLRHPIRSGCDPSHLRRGPGSIPARANRKRDCIPREIVPCRPSSSGHSGNVTAPSLPQGRAPSARRSKQSRSQRHFRSNRKKSIPFFRRSARRPASSPRSNPCPAPSLPAHPRHRRPDVPCTPYRPSPVPANQCSCISKDRSEKSAAACLSPGRATRVRSPSSPEFSPRSSSSFLLSPFFSRRSI